MLLFSFLLLLSFLCSVAWSLALHQTRSMRAARVSGLFMASRTPLIAGNWKMNTDLNSAVALAKELAELTKDVDTSKVELAVIPPYPFLTEVGKVRITCLNLFCVFMTHSIICRQYPVVRSNLERNTFTPKTKVPSLVQCLLGKSNHADANIAWLVILRDERFLERQITSLTLP